MNHAEGRRDRVDPSEIEHPSMEQRGKLIQGKIHFVPYTALDCAFDPELFMILEQIT